KLSQVRTLTAHNKPEGHVEPDWNYNQKTLSGDYSSLSDAELRAINIDPALVEHLREKPASKQALESYLVIPCRFRSIGSGFLCPLERTKIRESIIRLIALVCSSSR